MKKVIFSFLLVIFLFSYVFIKKDTLSTNADLNQNKDTNISQNFTENTIFADKLIKNFYLNLEDKEIYIEFFSPQNKSNLNDNPVLYFSPNDIRGKYRWLNDTILTYQIDNYTPNQTYRVNFSLKNYLNQNYRNLSFSIDFTTPRIMHLENKVINYNKNSSIQFTLDFDTPVSKDFIQNNLTITLNGERGYPKHLPVDKITRISNKRYYVKTKMFLSDEDIQRVELNFFSQKIDTYISYDDYLKDYRFRESNNKFKLYINLKDSIIPDDVENYIHIKGLNKYYVKKNKNALIVSGNFISGKDYTVTLQKGLGGLKTKDVFKVTTPNLQPVLEFKNEGMYISDNENKKIRFKTRNLKSVKLSIKKVEKHNMEWFKDSYGYMTGTKEKERFNSYTLLRFGTEIYSEKLDISSEKNRWFESDIDLNVLGDKYGKEGIYLVELDYNVNDILVPVNGYNNMDKNRNARTNYNFTDYLYSNAHITKTVILSDIGIIAKKTKDRLFVYTSKISTGEILDNVKITLSTRAGNKQGYTNKDGVAIFNADNWINIIAEKDNELSMVSVNKDYVNYSLADNSGIFKSDGVDAYIYTERGVYRPGDKIYLSAILFEKDKYIPEKMDVTAKIYSPRGKLYTTLTNRNGENSLYTFEFSTKSTNSTGNWKVELFMGKKILKTQYIKIEAIVPPKIKVKNTLSTENNILNAEINSEYLFGAKAKGLKYNMKMNISPAKNSFKNYGNFNFLNQLLNTNYSYLYRDGNLDSDGRATEKFNLNLEDVPFKLELLVNSDVFQKDGRKVSQDDKVYYDFYDSYVGIQKFGKYGEIGEKIKLATVTVDTNGKPLEMDIKYNVYKNDTYWWWDYSSYDSYKKHYKTSDDTILIESGETKSDETIEFTLEEYGNYYVEVVNPNGHRAGTFIRSGYYSYGNNKNDKFMKLEFDKKEYNLQDTAIVSFESPTKGYAIINIEQGNEILSSSRIPIEKGINKYSFICNDAKIPGVYVNVILLQNLRDKLSDKDIKLQGLQYIKIKRDKDIIKSEIIAEKKYKGMKEIKVKVKTDKPNTSFTLSAVDEGVLSITNYKSPDPYNYFFAKERYSVYNYDNYRYILDYNHDEAYKTFTPGGGDYEIMAKTLMEKSDIGINDAQRFKTVSMQKRGITDENGEAEMTFDIDDYTGELRFMLASVKDGAFGCDSKSAKIQSSIIILPGLPRTLAPKDNIISSLDLFINDAKSKNAKIGIKTEGPIQINGKNIIEIDGSKVGENSYEFNLKVLNETGNAKITYYFESEDFYKEKSVDIAINSPAPYQTYKEEYELAPFGNINFKINNEAVTNSSRAEIRVSRYPLYNLYGRLQYLISYPYGCIEQTVSSVFPQLYIDKFIALSNEEKDEITKNINSAIEKLRKFQLQNGAMSYWQDEDRVSPWGTNYTHYFLSEAKKKGYYVPDEMYSRLEQFQYNQAAAEYKVNYTNLHRLYVLAASGKENINSMNFYKQNEMKNLNNTEKFLLAGAYNMAGYKETAENIIKGLTYETDPYWDGNFGSELRDKALILDVISRMEKTDDSNALNIQILEKLAGKEWYSTQTTAYSLIAVSNYRDIKNDDIKPIKYQYIVDGETVDKTLVDSNEIIDISKYLGKSIELVNQEDEKLYINYFFQGKMNLDEQQEYANEIKLSVKYYDEDGNILDDISTTEKGQSIWAIYRIDKQKNKFFKNMAAFQNIPSGLEIENLRLKGSSLPQWIYEISSNVNYSRNMDIRDDKIVWFFDMTGSSSEKYFALKLNSVTKGSYYLPGAVVESMYSKGIGAGLEGIQIKVK